MMTTTESTTESPQLNTNFKPVPAPSGTHPQEQTMERYKLRPTIGIPVAARRLGVDVSTVRRYIRQGLLPAYRIGGQGFIRVNVDDVEALLVPVTS
jgi:excisionase family DNA binding protein